MPLNPSTFTIATAASEPYWRSLYQFLRSALRHRIAPKNRFVVYDLGFKPGTLDRLKSAFPFAEFRRFPFETYPPHVAVSETGPYVTRSLRGTYAWKPIVIDEMMAETTGFLLWLDSACLFKTGDLGPVLDSLQQTGLYVLRGRSPIAERADPATLAALSAPAEILHKPEIVAGVLGLDCSRGPLRTLVAEWKAHALIEAHIWPRTPPMPGHNPEQALLSILLLRAEDEGRLVLNRDEVDISSRTPIRWVTTRNKLRPSVPLWADPLCRLYYAASKAADRAALKWKHWHDTRLNGWHRWSKEHFAVFAMRQRDGAVSRIAAPRGSYYADPFIWVRDGRNWIFLEQFEYSQCLGRLVAVELDETLRAGPPVSVLDLECHASFPFLFEHEGRTYLLPETCHRKSIDLYVCEEFPHRWALARRLLFGVDAADSVLLHRNGLWWLITSLREEDKKPGRYLAIYFTGDLLRGTWQAHPVNAERLYHDEKFSSHRNGGPVLADGDLLLRVAQDNRTYYGEALQIMRIEELTPTAYRESPYRGDVWASRLAMHRSPHHVSACGGMIAWDIRDRAGYGAWLRLASGKRSRGMGMPAPASGNEKLAATETP